MNRSRKSGKHYQGRPDTMQAGRCCLPTIVPALKGLYHVWENKQRTAVKTTNQIIPQVITSDTHTHTHRVSFHASTPMHTLHRAQLCHILSYPSTTKTKNILFLLLRNLLLLVVLTRERKPLIPLSFPSVRPLSPAAAAINAAKKSAANAGSAAPDLCSNPASTSEEVTRPLAAPIMSITARIGPEPRSPGETIHD